MENVQLATQDSNELLKDYAKQGIASFSPSKCGHVTAVTMDLDMLIIYV